MLLPYKNFNKITLMTLNNIFMFIYINKFFNNFIYKQDQKYYYFYIITYKLKYWKKTIAIKLHKVLNNKFFKKQQLYIIKITYYSNLYIFQINTLKINNNQNNINIKNIICYNMFFYKNNYFWNNYFYYLKFIHLLIFNIKYIKNLLWLQKQQYKTNLILNKIIFLNKNLFKLNIKFL